MTLTQNIPYPLSALVITSIVALLILSPYQSFSSPVFDSTIPLATPPNSKFVDVALGSSGNVYATYINTNLVLTVAVSNDGGQTYAETPISTCLLNDRPKLAVSPNTLDSIYVVYRCTDDTVNLASSIDGGSSFSTALISSSIGTYDIAAVNDKAYITLGVDPTLSFYRYNNITLETSSTLTSTAITSSSHEIVVENSNVSVVWAGQDNLIHFIQSTDNGDSFNSIVDVSTAFADQAQIATGGSKLYVAWVKNNDDVYTSSSTDGVNFSSESLVSTNSAVSTNPDVSVDSSGVAYVVWHESDGFSNRDVFGWSSSTNSITNLSSDDNDSLNPKVRADAAGVVSVVWSENTDSDFIPDDEVLYRTSSDSGNSWQGLKNISKSQSVFGLSGVSHNPELAALNGDVAIAWDDSDGISEESTIFVSTSSTSTLEIYLNSTQYTAGETAHIKVIEPGNASPSINIAVASELDPVGIGLTLLATDPDTFEGDLSFTNGPSNPGIIQVAPDDVITVQYSSSETQEAMSFYKQGSLSFSPFSVNFDRGDISHIIVQDDLAVGLGSVVVHVSSGADPSGLDLTLPESPPNSGVFGGPSNNQIIFMETNNLIDVPTNRILTLPIQVNDSTQNNDNSIAETISATVSSTSYPAGINISLKETSNNSGFFSGIIKLSYTPTSAPKEQLMISANDILTVTYGTATTNGLIIPKTDSALGALLVNPASVGDDTITVEYNGNIITATVGDFIGSGGGGGGISRAGLVVQAVGSLALFGGGGTVSGPPLFDSSFILKEDGTKISPGSSTLAVGKQSNILMGFKMPGGLNDLDHVGLYANIGAGQIKSDSDTYIYFDKYKTPQITIHDPHGFFNSVNIDVTEPTKSNLSANFAFDFAKSLDNSNVVFEAWNLKRESALKEIPGLLKVTDTKIETPTEPETIHTDTPQRPPIPEWIKSNAAWWGKGAIDDNEFTNGIGYMIQKQIINVPGLLKKNTSPDVGLMDQPAFTPVVPAWVKNNALWWSEDKLTDDDFITGIKYLLEKGIIQVNS